MKYRDNNSSFPNFNPPNTKTLGYGLDNLDFESRPKREIFLFSKTSRPALEPIHHFSKVSVFLSQIYSGRDLMFIHLHLVPMLRISLAIPLLPIYRCPRRNGQNFGRVFLMLNYTDITQNTYIQS